jgi:hypothetical protein
MALSEVHISEVDTFGMDENEDFTTAGKRVGGSLARDRDSRCRNHLEKPYSA